MLEAGAKAPSFTLASASGEKQSLSGILERGPALLALFKISCPTCQVTFPVLDRLAKGSLQVFGISQDDERGTAYFERALHLTMPMLLDHESDGYPVSNAFGITHVPALFLVEQDGTVSLASVGFSKHDLEAIGRRAGVEPFRPDEKVPEWKAG
jgi:peroxiredoxin